jgi:hypothetical protein
VLQPKPDRSGVARRMSIFGGKAAAHSVEPQEGAHARQNTFTQKFKRSKEDQYELRHAFDTAYNQVMKLLENGPYLRLQRQRKDRETKHAATLAAPFRSADKPALDHVVPRGEDGERPKRMLISQPSTSILRKPGMPSTLQLMEANQRGRPSVVSKGLPSALPPRLSVMSLMVPHYNARDSIDPLITYSEDDVETIKPPPQDAKEASAPQRPPLPLQMQELPEVQAASSITPMRKHIRNSRHQPKSRSDGAALISRLQTPQKSLRRARAKSESTDPEERESLMAELTPVARSAFGESSPQLLPGNVL